jgi:hypothetical protein
MSTPRRTRNEWALLVAGPVLSLVSFVVAYYIDPLDFGGRKPLAAIPAFLLAIVILLISQNLTSSHELELASTYSDRIYEAVKDYLHVTKVGSPETAMSYVITRLPILHEVRNTTLNLRDETERADEQLYDTPTYTAVAHEIAVWAAKNGRWKDIGDRLAVARLRHTLAASREAAGKGRCHYQYKLIEHKEPQINFILLGYPDGTNEVLFNWDFRNIGQDPVVLLSRDRDIVEMFAIQFEHLWRVASPDHDSTDTRSNSKQ